MSTIAQASSTSAPDTKARSILSRIHLEPSQIAERRVPGAEVVDGDPDTRVAEGTHHADLHVSIFHEQRLGYLDLQCGRWKPGLLEHVEDFVNDVLTP